MKFLVPLCICASIGAAQTPLTLRVPNLSVPAGAMAQIQVYAGRPVALVSGELVLDLDPAVFAPIAAADVFSCTGDQVGAATIQDRHLDVKFISKTGGIGRLPGLPILVVTVPVLSGTASAITVKPGAGTWKDVENVVYTLGNGTATLTVGGGLSISGVNPGGGLLPAGTKVQVGGTGFTSATQIAVDGVAIGGTQFASAQEIDFTVTGPTDLTGKHLVAKNPDGTQAEFFPALRGAYVQRPSTGGLANIQPIFPQQRYPAGNAGSFIVSNAGVALQNPTLQSVDVNLTAQSTSLNGESITNTTVTLPPGSIYFTPGSQLAGGLHSILSVNPVSPIWMALVDPTFGPSAISPATLPLYLPFAELTANGQIFNATNPVTWHWAAGSAVPAAMQLAVVLEGWSVPFTAAADSPWLVVSSGQGTTCGTPGFAAPTCSAASQIAVSVDPSKLAPGAYHGNVTLTPQVFGGTPGVIPVVLNVESSPMMFADQSQVDFGGVTSDSSPQSFPVHLTTNNGTQSYTVTVTTKSGKNWLTASPLSGTAPGTLFITANPAIVPAPGDSGVVTITGASNTLSIPVSMQVSAPQQQAQQFNFTPTSLTFSVQAGQTTPPMQAVDFSAFLASSPFTVSAQAADGANWLSAAPSTGPGVPFVVVNVNQAGLAPGTYHGTVTVTSPLTSAPGQVPVTLVVWSTAPPVTVSAKSLTFTATAGVTVPTQTFDIATGGTPMYYSVTTKTLDGAGWLHVATPGITPVFQEVPTPVTATVSVDPSIVAPGIYHGSITVAAPANSNNTAVVDVTLTVAPGAPPLPLSGVLPLVSEVLNGASFQSGGVSPGEIVTILGQNIGPLAPAGFATGADGKVVTSLGGAQVLFDGVAAPLLYASATQINAIVPYEIAGKTTTNVQLQFNSTAIPAGTVPVVPSAVAIFAVLNQDNTINSPANPASQGSVLQVYATGEGAVTPTGITGEITGSDVKQPVLPVTVTIGGTLASVIYAASAPGSVAGLFQVDVAAPKGGTLVLSVGTASASIAVSVQ